MLTDASKIWKKALEILKEKVPVQSFSTWFEPTSGGVLKQNTLWIEVPNAFFIDWLEEHYHGLIHEILAEICGAPIKVNYKVLERTRERTSPGKLYREDTSHLQPRYTFDNFVVGEGNKFARAAAFAVANTPGKRYNPLFLYGTVGLGKTHLLQAIGNVVKQKTSHLKVHYTSCETFVNELVDAIQNRRTLQFKNKYRHKDVLLIDDIQFLEGKETAQEEMFYTFNSLYDTGSQIVLSSDRPPSALSTLEERLVSRLQGGLVCDIRPPSLETRMAILKQKAELSGVQVPGEIISFIAERIKFNVRELEGALIKLLALSTLTDVQINIATAQEFLKDVLAPYKDGISPQKIQKAVAEHYNVSMGALRGNRRMQAVVIPRQIAMYLTREYTASSLKEIGRAFGGKDHTTIIHAYAKIRKRMEREEEFREEVINIAKRINGE